MASVTVQRGVVSARGDMPVAAGVGPGHLQAWDELQIPEALRNQVGVYIARDRPVCHYAQAIDFDAALGQAAGPLECEPMGTLAGSAPPVQIMKRRRPVQADPHLEGMILQKPGPFRRQEHSVGLNRVAYHLAAAPELFHVGNRTFEEGDSGQCRFTALPAENGSSPPELHRLPDQFAEDCVGHLLGAAMGSSRAPIRFSRRAPVIEAVGAVEIAVGAYRLDEEFNAVEILRDHTVGCFVVR